MRIARRFNAGVSSALPKSRRDGWMTAQPSLRDLSSIAIAPGVETPGYFRLSPLRDSNFVFGTGEFPKGLAAKIGTPRVIRRRTCG